MKRPLPQECIRIVKEFCILWHVIYGPGGRIGGRRALQHEQRDALGMDMAAEGPEVAWG